MGLETEAINIFSEFTNSTYQFVAPEDREWGRINETGQWTGMVGKLFTKRYFLRFSKSLPLK